MSNNQQQSSLLRALITIGIILLMPFLVMKVTKIIKNDGKITKINIEDEEKINSAIEKYLANHQDKLVSLVMNGYYERYLGDKNSEKLVNAIVLYHKILFNERLPRIYDDKNKEKMNVMMFFSDFDSVVPMLEKIHEVGEKSQINIYFRQIITQNKFSAVISRYGQAVFHINPELFIPFYLSILKIPKADLSEEKINDVIVGLGLDLSHTQQLANSEETEILTKENNELAKKLGVSQLPAWIMENGRIVFGIGGFEIIKNLMDGKNEE